MNEDTQYLTLPANRVQEVAKSKNIVKGRKVIERYQERLESGAKRLSMGPEASELYCALSELYDGIIDDDADKRMQFYGKALEAFSHSRAVHAGLRRLYRRKNDLAALEESFERDGENASAKRKIAILTEFAQSLLYLFCDAQRASRLSDDIEALRDDVYDKDAPFDPSLFYLNEEILWCTRRWEALESHLRGALGQSELSDAIQRRLLDVYLYLAKDERKSSAVCAFLCESRHDPDVVRLRLDELRDAGNHEAMVKVLDAQLEFESQKPEAEKDEWLYRLMLADLARYDFEDFNLASKLMREGLERFERDRRMLKSRLEIEIERNDKEAILETLTKFLDIVSNNRERAQLLYDIAIILRDELEQFETAGDFLEEANAVCPAHEASLVALSKQFKRQKRFDALAELLESELDYLMSEEEATPEILREKHETLAELYELKLNMPLQAFRHYEAALSVRPDALNALKGVARCAKILDYSANLLKIYANAESVTQNPREHAYLLRRICDIALHELNDRDTAVTALQALKDIDIPNHSDTSTLARLYLELERYEDAVALNNEEIEKSDSPVYAASLLRKNAMICVKHFEDRDAAISYLKKAEAIAPTESWIYRDLHDIYEEIEDWDAYVELGQRKVEAFGNSVLSVEMLHRMAEVYAQHLNRDDLATACYQKALELDPKDKFSILRLKEIWRNEKHYEAYAEILEKEISVTHFSDIPHKFYELGEVFEHRLDDCDNAFKNYRKAYGADPENLLYFEALKRLAVLTHAQNELTELIDEKIDDITDNYARARILFHRARTACLTSPEQAFDILKNLRDADTSHQFSDNMLNIALALTAKDSENWKERALHAMQEQNALSDRLHGFEMTLILGCDNDLKDAFVDVLFNVDDFDVSAKLRSRCTPKDQPPIRDVDRPVLEGSTQDAQDLRRIFCLKRLLSGNIEEPTEALLPDEQDESLSLRSDLELLCAYFEIFEKWDKLLEVFQVMLENTRQEAERIQLIVQKAWVLSKLQRPSEALASVRDACKSCSFSNPMRLSLYDHLTEQQDWDFLIEELRQHIIHTDTPEKKQDLLKRLAAIFEDGLGSHGEALRCLDQAYREFPSDGKLLVSIASTAKKMQEIDIARRALEDFIQFHSPDLETQISILPNILELHFDNPSPKSAELLNYFESIAQFSAQDPRALKCLAFAHAKEGNAEYAAEILLRLVKTPFEEEQCELWLMLCKLYNEKLDEKEKGSGLLWKLFEEFPDNAAIFAALNAMPQNREEKILFVNTLRHAVQSNETINRNPELVRKFLTHCGNVFGNELGMWKDAQTLFSEALAQSENNEQKSELLRQRAYARCRIPGEAYNAYREFCDLIVDDPTQSDIIKTNLDICQRNQAFDRERILLQIAETFIPEQGLHLQNMANRPKVDINRPIAEDVLLKYLRHPELKVWQPLLNEAMPIFNSALEDHLPKRSLLGGSKNKDPEIAALFHQACNALGFGPPRIIISSDAELSPMVLDSPATVKLSEELWNSADVSEKRYHAGYGACLLWTGLSRLIFYPDKDLFNLIDATFYLSTGKSVDVLTAVTVHTGEKLKSPWLRRERKEVAAILENMGARLTPQNTSDWKFFIKATADRNALLLCGNISAAVKGILRTEGWSLTDDRDKLRRILRQSPRIPALLRFALSDDYLILRRHAGLATAPSVISD